MFPFLIEITLQPNLMNRKRLTYNGKLHCMLHFHDLGISHAIFLYFFWFSFAEYGYMMKITEKSDVYSYGVVALEVLTGKQPIDPTIPDGLHIVDWVRQTRGGVEVLDASLRARPESEIEEILQTLGVALLCVNPSPDDRPTMKDVAAMLKEIRQEREESMKVDMLLNGPSSANDREESNSPSGVPSAVMQHSQNSYLRSNSTSFSASSLLYSASSNAKATLK